jgi:cytochrome d ubiquinol oxidase subunit II
MVTVWFGLVVLCWVLFFVLEGFDFGVGILTPLLGRDDHERGAVVRTVGPFWDGNEVWLVAAIGVTFAAFPAWYAALLSGLYLPMVALLLLLAGRGVALEFRGKGDGIRWRRWCDGVLAACSAGIVALWGAVLTVFLRGLPLGADGEVTGGFGRSLAPVLSPAAGVGAVLALGAALLLGTTFLTLRTTGPVRRRARRWTIALAVGGAAAMVAVVITGAVAASGVGGVVGVAAPVAAAVLLGVASVTRSRHEALAFGGAALGVAAAVVTVLTAHGPVVLPSTLDPAWSLTMTGAAATDSALRLLSVVGVVVLPGVLVYQAFSYWVFRRRVSSERVSSS